MEVFSEYAEDYNTATMVHEKYYDLEKWEVEERDAPESVFSSCFPVSFCFKKKEKLKLKRYFKI